MNIPLEVNFRGVERTDEIDQVIDQKVRHLEKICNNIMRCQIAVEKTQAHQNSGSGWRVRILMRIPPGKELVARQEPGEGILHETLEQTLRATFDAAEKQLKKELHRMRGDVKSHPHEQVMALVERIFPAEGYGFIRTPEGEEIYFHKNSVLHHDFDRLAVGVGVRYVAELGDHGLQASTVEIMSKLSH